MLLQWHITERCNLRCTHCYQDGRSTVELGLTESRRLLDDFVDLLAGRPGQVTITGGEPLVRSEFFDLCGEVVDRGLGLAVLTNGVLIDDDCAGRLSALSPRFVQVSIEGDRDTHDRIRGAGSYERAIAGLKRLIGRGVPTQISFTAHRGNVDQFSHVADLGCELGVSRVWSDRLIPCGSGAELAGLDAAQTRRLFEAMQEARDRAAGATEIAMHRALQFLVAGGKPYHCAAGRRLLTVLPNGDLVPCRRMPIRVGNVTATPLGELYEKSDWLQALRDPNRTPDGCRGCRYERRCGGGLRCLAYAVHGTPFATDPGCWRACT
ncbi:MAG: radical SAM protein [Deltaproteobacteria bacterium]|jgi:radical SAM protein with 4Fe4S-binding SPASM domain|nr:radical SAM protein [Deltaproteobacteria bacterium]MBW2537086.1 radical SAM protein [Deltaproteobacteria bacterium]